MPGQEIVINHEGASNHAHEDVYVAIRDAFDALDRRLEDTVRRRDHRAKVHEVPPHGRVVRIFQYEGYGFVETSDGVEVYFHKNSVVDGGFGNLELGDEVRVELSPEQSEKGPQASTIRPVGKHHLVG
jgi:cold shock CspA family protein